MKKTLLTGMFLSLVVLVLFGCSLTDKIQDEVVENIETVVEDTVGGGSVEEILKSNLPQKCTWETDQDGTMSKGVMYVNAQTSRIESEATYADGTTYVSYMIVDPDWIYTWDPAKPNEGLKMKNESSEVVETGETEEMDLDTESFDSSIYENIPDVEYKCEVWIPDSSLLTPPEDVTFTDFSAIMEDFQDSMGDLSGFCDMLEGQEKEDCLAGFN